MLAKIAFADHTDILLARGSPDRPAARYNRRGQDALYLSRDEESARVAMRKYAGESSAPRVLVRYEVQPCRLVDLRHADAEELRRRSSSDWRVALESGTEPPSWQVADRLRDAGEVGLIDPSRTDPELWHVTLFRWNEPGAPRVTVVGRPVPLSI